MFVRPGGGKNSTSYGVNKVRLFFGRSTMYVCLGKKLFIANNVHFCSGQPTLFSCCFPFFLPFVFFRNFFLALFLICIFLFSVPFLFPFFQEEEAVTGRGLSRRHSSKGRLSWSDDYGGCLAEYFEVRYFKYRFAISFPAYLIVFPCLRKFSKIYQRCFMAWFAK